MKTILILTTIILVIFIAGSYFDLAAEQQERMTYNANQ